MLESNIIFLDLLKNCIKKIELTTIKNSRVSYEGLGLKPRLVGMVCVKG